MEREKAKEKKISNPGLVILIFFATAIQAPLLFWPAGTFYWIEGWVYLLIFFVTFSIIQVAINNKNPEVISNRMKMRKQAIRKRKEKKSDEDKIITKASGTDKIIFPLFSVFFLTVFIIPALDRRFNWTTVNIWFELIGFILLPVSFYIIYRVMLENAHVSKVLDIREDSGQKLVDTGPYAVVRHPMYSGFSLMVISIALSLGSWYALFPAILAIIFLAIRIHFEEKMLMEGLEGYKEYKNRVKFKLIPKLF